MTIVVTGGGSGGHITPIVAVAEQLKKLAPELRVIYIGQRGDGLGDIPASSPFIDEAYTISAGKFRRYHGEGIRQLLDMKTLLLNLRDAFRVVAGYVQARRLLRRIKPDLIFIKGGFVGVPVGLAAGHLHLPYFTHDSDAIPGLANRIIANRAACHAVALPKEVYNYPPAKTVTVGVPVAAAFQRVTHDLKTHYRRELSVPVDARVLFVIGGGLGAQRVNQAVAACASGWLSSYPDLLIFHAVGRANEAEMQQSYDQKLEVSQRGRVHIMGYTTEVYRYSGAADVIITRAGATNLAEFAAQGRACVVVPNPYLTAGHQLKNASYLASKGAIEVVREDQLEPPDALAATVHDLLGNPAKQAELASAFYIFAHPESARELAELLLTNASTAA